MDGSCELYLVNDCSRARNEFFGIPYILPFIQLLLC